VGGAGDTVGAASSTDNAIARFDGIGGKTLQNSLVTVDDSGSVNIPAGQTYKINNVALAKGDVGLSSVDNTSDASKPVSTAQQTALNLKANLTANTFTDTQTIARGSVSSGSGLAVTSTWTGGGTFPGSIFLNITDTSSAAASLLMDLQVGGVSKFSVRKDGTITSPTNITVNSGGQAVTAGAGSIYAALGYQVGNGAQVTFSNGTNFSAGFARSATGSDHLRATNGGSGNLTFEASGFAQAINASAKTSAYTVTVADGTIINDSTSGTFVENLPAANAVAPGRMFVMLNIGTSNQVTITRAGSDTITDGSTTGGTTYALTNASRVHLQSDGVSVWYVIGK
jgi:hypothetical protein